MASRLARGRLASAAGLYRHTPAISSSGARLLAATRLVADLSERLRRRLSPTIVWEHPSIERLVRHLLAPGSDTQAGEEEAPDRDPDEPIAIVGMACRLPGAPSIGAFWELLREGREAVGDVPPGRWTDGDPGDASPQEAKAMRRAGFVDDIAGFDPLFFGITSRAA